MSFKKIIAAGGAFLIVLSASTLGAAAAYADDGTTEPETAVTETTPAPPSEPAPEPEPAPPAPPPTEEPAPEPPADPPADPAETEPEVTEPEVPLDETGNAVSPEEPQTQRLTNLAADTTWIAWQLPAGQQPNGNSVGEAAFPQTYLPNGPDSAACETWVQSDKYLVTEAPGFYADGILTYGEDWGGNGQTGAIEWKFTYAGDCAKIDFGITPATCTKGEILVEGEGKNASWDDSAAAAWGTVGPASYSISATANPGAKGEQFVNGVAIFEGTLKGPDLSLCGYVTVAWLAPGGAPPNHFTLPQIYKFSQETDTPQLNVLDPQIVAYVSEVTCGTVDFQVDVYYDDATTDALISPDGPQELYGPNNPTEHLIPGGSGVAWKFLHYEFEPCSTSTPVTPDVPMTNDLCETFQDAYVLPAAETGITYTFSGQDVVATLGVGYVWDTLPAGYTDNGDGTATYKFSALDFTDEPCLSTEPLVIPTAVPSDPTCFGGASYTLDSDQPPGAILWTVNGTPGVTDGTYSATQPSTVTVEAAPGPGYGFGFPQQTTWVLPFGPPIGCLETLALTSGSASWQLGGLAGLLMLGGVFALQVRARNRLVPREQSVLGRRERLI